MDLIYKFLQLSCFYALLYSNHILIETLIKLQQKHQQSELSCDYHAFRAFLIDSLASNPDIKHQLSSLLLSHIFQWNCPIPYYFLFL